MGRLQVCPLGFGTWGLGGVVEGAPPAYGPTEDAVSLQALRVAWESGIDFYDTSGLYGLGHAEELLGQALPAQALIATKAGYRSAQGAQDFQFGYLRAQLEASLRRLGRDRVGLFQLHDPPLACLTDELMEALCLWRQQGLCESIGISLRSPADALAIVGRWPIDCVQLNFSLVDQRARVCGALELCRRHGVGVIARTPLCFGFLARNNETEFGAGDHRARWSPDQRQRWSQAPGLFREALGREYSGSDVQFALAFCLAFAEIGAVIPGMLTPEQVLHNVDTLRLPPLSRSERQRLEEVYAEHEFVVTPRSS